MNMIKILTANVANTGPLQLFPSEGSTWYGRGIELALCRASADIEVNLLYTESNVAPKSDPFTYQQGSKLFLSI